MPDTKLVIWACIGIAIIMVFAGALAWVITHFALVLVIMAVIGGGIYAYRYARQQQNRV